MKIRSPSFIYHVHVFSALTLILSRMSVSAQTLGRPLSSHLPADAGGSTGDEGHLVKDWAIQCTKGIFERETIGKP